MTPRPLPLPAPDAGAPDAAPCAPDADAAFPVDGPLDLAGTLGILQRGAHDPTARVAAGRAWLCFATPDGPASLHLLHDAAAGCVAARAWGPGAARAIGGVPGLLGRGDDWSGFDAAVDRSLARGPGVADDRSGPGPVPLAAPLPRLAAEARRRNRGVRLPATGRVFDALVPAILEQKVTTIEARFAWRFLAARFGEPAPGPVPEGMRLAPGPAALRRIGSWDWHAARVDDHRRAAVLRAAERATAIDRLGALPLAGDPGGRLQSVPGIGPWTAAEVLQRTHGHPDMVSVGDFHLASHVGYALTGRPTDDVGMLRLLEPWRGHRQRVVRMIGLSGFRKPKFGPRLAPMDHRRR